MVSTVPPAPSSAVVDGRPAHGTYAGVVGRTAWDDLDVVRARSGLWRRTRRKRWHWVGVFTDEVAVVGAAVDVGWSGVGFVGVLERRTGRLLADGAWPSWPGAATIADTPGPGARSRWSRGGRSIEVDVDGGGSRGSAARGAEPPPSSTLTFRARGPELELDATLGDAADGRPGLAAIATPPGATASCTHKRTGLPARGTLRAGGRTFSLDGGFGVSYYSVAILGRETRWRWAAATGPTLGLNFVDGFIGAAENVVWHAGRMVPVGEVSIAFDAADPGAPWRITTADGVVELTFRPEGLRRQDQDLKLAVSRYVQPFGVFEGTLRLPDGPVAVRDLVGVTEDHLSVW